MFFCWRIQFFEIHEREFLEQGHVGNLEVCDSSQVDCFFYEKKEQINKCGLIGFRGSGIPDWNSFEFFWYCILGCAAGKESPFLTILRGCVLLPPKVISPNLYQTTAYHPTPETPPEIFGMVFFRDRSSLPTQQ